MRGFLVLLTPTGRWCDQPLYCAN